MAIVGVGYEGSITLIDNGGNTTQRTYQLRATTPAEAVTAIASIASALNAISDASIVGYTANQVFAEDALVYPASGVQLENQALVAVAIADNPLKTATFSVPAPTIGIFAGTVGKPANVVDTADADLVTYANLFKSTGSAYISDGEDLDFMKEGKRIHRKSRNG
jgi:hypothetical protein